MAGTLSQARQKGGKRVRIGDRSIKRPAETAKRSSGIAGDSPIANGFN